LQKYCEFKNSGFFQKFSELLQPIISETRKNKKFRKFHLTQGLTKNVHFLQKGFGFELVAASELNLEGVQFNKVKTYRLFTFAIGTYI